MTLDEKDVVPLGDRALLVRLGTVADAASAARVQALMHALRDEPMPGQRDLVPAYTTVTVHYRPEQVMAWLTDDDALCPAFDRLRRALLERAAGLTPRDAADAREVVVPVWYGGDAGPDLEHVARRCKLDPEEVIARHLDCDHRVAMLGFAPGFPFITGLDVSLRMPRRETPRTAVPAGSVAIAREQSCIYTLSTPGGWNLLGRTPMSLFDAQAEPPSRLRAGDRIRFERIDEAQYQAMLNPKRRSATRKAGKVAP